MNLRELSKGLSEFVYERANNPFVWIFTVCFLFTHWDDVLVLLFSPEVIQSKISYIKNSISTSTFYSFHYQSKFFYIITPLVSALLISVSYPILSIVAATFSDFASSCRNRIAQYFDSENFLSKSASVEIKNERAELIETFNRQLQDNQKQIRESQQQFMHSQSNCAALFCALGFSKGMESLLPYTDLFTTFVAKNEKQRDILLLIEETTRQSSNIRVSALIEHIQKSDVFPSLAALSEDQITEELEELKEASALVARFRVKSRGRDNIDLETDLNLSPIGRKFAQSVNKIRNQDYRGAMQIGNE